MPIQVHEEKFIEFRYDPDYLQSKKERPFKSYPDIICDRNGIKTNKTDLVIDGGNVIKSKEAVIMTDKVIVENRYYYSRDILIGKLQELFETDRIALIPWDKKNDEYGHADGMIRFIDSVTVLLQGYYDLYDNKFRNQLYGELDRLGLRWEKMVIHDDKHEDLTWAYMNFLQTKDIMMVPVFGIPEDIQGIEQISKSFKAYPKDRIKAINMSKIIQYGGALNCINWNIKS